MSMSYTRVAAICSLSLLLGAWQSDLKEEGRRAREAMLAHRYDQAIVIYRKMVAALPDQPNLRFNFALALHSGGRYREAANELESIRGSQENNPKYWFLLGLAYLKLGDPGKAIPALEDAVRLDPATLDNRLELASAFLEAGRFDSAQKEFRQLSTAHPELPKVWEGLALSQFELSRGAFAALAKSPASASLRYGLAAVAEAEAGDTAKAEDSYRRALAEQPQAPWMRAELAALARGPSEKPKVGDCDVEPLPCAFYKGDWSAVAAATAKLRDPASLYWVCRAYSQMARESVAELAALPPSAEQHQMLARAYTELGHRSEAIEELRLAARLSPNDPLVRGQLARQLWTDRRYEEAIALLNPLVAGHPEQPEWQFELGDALFSMGKTEEATPHLQQAVALAPNLLPAQAKLGELLLRRGDAAGAVPHLERAESLDQDGSLHYQLAVAYRRLGKTELASRAMTRQQELQQHSGNPSH